MHKAAYKIMAVVILGCAAMALIETLLEPPYLIKSGLKIAIFLLLPLLCLGSEGKTGFKTFFLPGKRGFRQSLFLGLSLYAFILGAFLLTKTTFDYGTIVEALAKDQGVSQENFIPVAAYISLGNSLLEEFFFGLWRSSSSGIIPDAGRRTSSAPACLPCTTLP